MINEVLHDLFYNLDPFYLVVLTFEWGAILFVFIIGIMGIVNAFKMWLKEWLGIK